MGMEADPATRSLRDAAVETGGVRPSPSEPTAVGRTT